MYIRSIQLYELIKENDEQRWNDVLANLETLEWVQCINLFPLHTGAVEAGHFLLGIVDMRDGSHCVVDPLGNDMIYEHMSTQICQYLKAAGEALGVKLPVWKYRNISGISAVTEIDYYSSPGTRNNELDSSFESVSEQMLVEPPNLQEFNDRKRRQEEQIKKFNDRIKVQIDMSREISARVEQLENVGQQSLNLTVINQKSMIESVAKYAVKMSNQVETIQHRLRLPEGREYMKSPLNSTDIEAVEYDYKKVGMTVPEYTSDLIAKVEYEEPVIRAMTLQSTTGKSTLVDGYTIEEITKSNYNTRTIIGAPKQVAGVEMTGFNIPRGVVQGKLAAAHKTQEEENKKRMK